MTSNIKEYHVGWCRMPVGVIANNGVAWNFSYEESWLLPLSAGENRPGVMPYFIRNLFPEGLLADAICGCPAGSEHYDVILDRSERYMSNIAVVKDVDRLRELPVDMLAGRLSGNSDESKVFTGKLVDMPSTSSDLISELNKVITDIDMPRESGHQPKIPCFLDEDGSLMPAMSRPFTHIVKLAGLKNDPFYLRGALEWASMTLARGGGVKTCDFALLQMGSGALAYVCERFDIPQDEDDMRLIYTEDFCSVNSKGTIFKYFNDGVESITKPFMKHATPSDEDKEQLLRMFYSNWLLENGDFHLKNISLMRIAEPTLEGFRSTRLAPAYDIMNTRYFSDTPKPAEFRESMVLDYRGKNTDFTIDDFKSIVRPLGIDPDRAEEIMWETAHGIAETAQNMANNLPPLLDTNPRARAVVTNLLERAVSLCRQDFDDIPEISVNQAASADPADGDEPAVDQAVSKARRLRP